MTVQARATILLVEDDPDVRDAVAESLEDHGYRVLLAAHGEEALQQLRRSSVRPSLILLDLMMPVMDGWHFREEQKKDPLLADIPVVALTAHGNLREFDANDHLRKPISLETLLGVVDRFCPLPSASQGGEQQ